jgi:hypothetical protein
MKAIEADIFQHKERVKPLNLEGRPTLLCAVRKKRVPWTPEEMVRQCVLLYLIENLRYPSALIAVEKKVAVNGMPKRFDILVLDRSARPFLLVECKADFVPLAQGVFDQAARYNLILGAPYLLLTNGWEAYCCSIDAENRRYDFLDALPPFPAP